MNQQASARRFGGLGHILRTMLVTGMAYVFSYGIMLVLTSEHTHGMLTTKFYEALGCEKPVLCVPSDKGALAELIRYTNAGIASDDNEVIKKFILDTYNEWQQNGFTRQATQHRNEFTREAQYDQFYCTYL